MSKFQIVSAYINLSGSRDNVVFRGGPEAITFPESVVLAAIHGGDEAVHTLVVQGTVERTMAEEHERLLNLYGAIVDKVFPKAAGMVMLPLGDESLPTQEEVDASAAAAAAAAEKVRAKRAAKSKTEAAKPDVDAPAAPTTDATPPLPFGDELPSLTDLPS